jgi:hypothetical protein
MPPGSGSYECTRPSPTGHHQPHHPHASVCVCACVCVRMSYPSGNPPDRDTHAGGITPSGNPPDTPSCECPHASVKCPAIMSGHRDAPPAGAVDPLLRMCVQTPIAGPHRARSGRPNDLSGIALRDSDAVLPVPPDATQQYPSHTGTAPQTHGPSP